MCGSCTLLLLLVLPCVCTGKHCLWLSSLFLGWAPLPFVCVCGGHGSACRRRSPAFQLWLEPLLWLFPPPCSAASPNVWIVLCCVTAVTSAHTRPHCISYWLSCDPQFMTHDTRCPVCMYGHRCCGYLSSPYLLPSLLHHYSAVSQTGLCAARPRLWPCAYYYIH